jgi:hypothetical protein
VNGPAHYAEAEQLLAEITNDDGSVGFGEEGEAYVAAAQVHATLALAASLLAWRRDIDSEPMPTFLSPITTKEGTTK